MKIFNKLIVASIISSSILLAGCVPTPEGSNVSVREGCIKGVTYYYTGHKLSPAFKPDGSLYTCDLNKIQIEDSK